MSDQKMSDQKTSNQKMSIDADRKIREDQDREYEELLRLDQKKHDDDDDDMIYQQAIVASLLLSNPVRKKPITLPNPNIELRFRLLDGKFSRTYHYNENESVETIVLDVSIDYDLTNITLQFQSKKLFGTLKESNVRNKSILIVLQS